LDIDDELVLPCESVVGVVDDDEELLAVEGDVALSCEGAPLVARSGTVIARATITKRTSPRR